MSPTRQTAFRLPTELLEAMQRIKERDRVPFAQQVNLALEAWLKSKGEVVEKSGRKRAATRKRP